jgi:hypothetical protein
MSALLFPKKLLQTSLNVVQAASSTSFKRESKGKFPHLWANKNPCCRYKKKGPSFFIGLTQFFTEPSFIWSGCKNTFAASTKG